MLVMCNVTRPTPFIDVQQQMQAYPKKGKFSVFGTPLMPPAILAACAEEVQALPLQRELRLERRLLAKGLRGSALASALLKSAPSLHRQATFSTALMALSAKGFLGSWNPANVVSRGGRMKGCFACLGMGVRVSNMRARP